MPTFREFMRVADLTIKDKTSGKRMGEIRAILKKHEMCISDRSWGCTWRDGSSCLNLAPDAKGRKLRWISQPVLHKV